MFRRSRTTWHSGDTWHTTLTPGQRRHRPLQQTTWLVTHHWPRSPHEIFHAQVGRCCTSCARCTPRHICTLRDWARAAVPPCRSRGMSTRCRTALSRPPFLRHAPVCASACARVARPRRPRAVAAGAVMTCWNRSLIARGISPQCSGSLTFGPNIVNVLPDPVCTDHTRPSDGSVGGADVVRAQVRV